ncbi:MAG: hypothetical protein HDR54_03420 [Treponema sp.]|nr:hypothetical protein [Treponema sp.]
MKSLKEKYEINYTIHFDENPNVCDFNKVVVAAYVDTITTTVRVVCDLDVLILNLHMKNGAQFTLPKQKVFLFK